MADYKEGSRALMVEQLNNTAVPRPRTPSYATFSSAYAEAMTNILSDAATNGEVEYSYLSPKLEKANYKVDSFENLLMALNYVFLLEESKGNSQARAYSGTLETRIKIYRHDILKLF